MPIDVSVIGPISHVRCLAVYALQLLVGRSGSEMKFRTFVNNLVLHRILQRGRVGPGSSCHTSPAGIAPLYTATLMAKVG